MKQKSHNRNKETLKQDLSSTQKKIQSIKNTLEKKELDHFMGRNTYNIHKQTKAKKILLFVITDLISGILVGIVAGIILDTHLQTSPLFFMICFCIGSFVGFYNIWLHMQNNEKKK